MPRDGIQLDAKGLLRHLRDHLNDRIDPQFAEFAPYDAIDNVAWTSSSTGAALDIDMKLCGSRVDRGSVVVTEGGGRSLDIFDGLDPARLASSRQR